MMLTEQQLQALLGIIDTHHNAFIANFVSPTALPPEVLQRLQAAGVVAPQVQGMRDAYLYGMLAANLPDTKPGRGSRLTYAKLSDKLRRNPFPLSEVERQAISAAQMTAGQYISGLGARVKAQAGELVMQADAATRAADRKAYRKTIAHAIEARKQHGSVVSDLGHATGDWARNLERVATTELSHAMQQGTAQVVGKTHGPKARVAIQSSPLCCDQCGDLTLEPGTRRPKIFTLSQLEANGTNVGRKAKSWRPVIGPIHPNCFLAGEPVTTGRGAIAIESVQVGDWVLTHKGRWRQVTRTWVSWFEGNMLALSVDGMPEPLTCTPKHQLAVGHEAWWPADIMRTGGYLVSLLALTAPPPARGQLGQMVSAERWLGAAGEPEVVIRTPFGLFAGLAYVEEGTAAGEILSSLGGGWRVGHAGINRLAEVATMAKASGGSHETVNTQPQCFPNHLTRQPRRNPFNSTKMTSPVHSGPVLLARHSVACLKIGDKLRFGGAVPRPVDMPSRCARERPRRIAGINKRPHRGQVYNLSVDEDESYLVRGLGVHNCGCQLVHVPEGMGFDETGLMVPSSMAANPPR